MDVRLVLNDGIATSVVETVSFPCALAKSGCTTATAAGDDGDLEMGEAWPSTRFTINDGTTHGYFTDNLTGLMWQRYAYSNATWSTALSRVEAMELGGYDNWRLPNINELRSLLSFGNFNPTTQAPFSAWSQNPYFSSTTVPNFNSYAASILLRTGEIYQTSKSAVVYYVAVRTSSTTGTVSLASTGQTNTYAVADDGAYQSGTEWPTNRFQDNDDNTVTDNLYGLMWSKNPLGSSTWNTMLTACNNSTLAGYTDWRMPNVVEMMSLMDMNGTYQMPSGWPGSFNQNYYYWTSSAFADSPSSYAWAVRFPPTTATYSLGYYSKGNGFYTYAVRTADPAQAPDPIATVPLQATGQGVSYADGDDGTYDKGEWLAFAATWSTEGNRMTEPFSNLQWTRYPQLFSGSWSEAVAYCNDLVFDGLSDWRMPNVQEMMSIVNFGRTNPALFSSAAGALLGGGFASTYYWTSTTSGQDTNRAWGVNMLSGYQYPVSKTSTYYVYPVRQSGGRMPKTGQTASYAPGDDGAYQYGVAEPYAAASRFVDHENGTVTDRRTDLMWLQTASPMAATNWMDAVGFCNSMTYGGHTDWRMPNVRELVSLFDYGQSSSAIPADFPLMNVQTNLSYWTSTTYAGSTNQAWAFVLEEAVPVITSKTFDNYFLPVRDDVQP